MNTYKVWYSRHPTFSENDVPTCLEDLETHWALVRTIMAESLNHVYDIQQGEVWSPNGEAQPLIRKLGLTHTSMSVGDVIEHNGAFFVVTDFGFARINMQPSGVL